MSSPTTDQIGALLDFLEEHRDLALRSVDRSARSRRLWEEISTKLNALGGCFKTTEQWQEVWNDMKYMPCDPEAFAARRSASATGGGPSTAPQLSPSELRVISIMGEEFWGPHTSAKVPAFPEQSVSEPPTASLPSKEEGGNGHATRGRQRLRRLSLQPRAFNSVRDRLFRIEERRVQNERRRNEELAGIRAAILELCGLMREFLERQASRQT